jgi:hypothetical protein
MHSALLSSLRNKPQGAENLPVECATCTVHIYKCTYSPHRCAKAGYTPNLHTFKSPIFWHYANESEWVKIGMPGTGRQGFRVEATLYSLDEDGATSKGVDIIEATLHSLNED